MKWTDDLARVRSRGARESHALAASAARTLRPGDAIERTRGQPRTRRGAEGTTGWSGQARRRGADDREPERTETSRCESPSEPRPRERARASERERERARESESERERARASERERARERARASEPRPRAPRLAPPLTPPSPRSSQARGVEPAEPAQSSTVQPTFSKRAVLFSSSHSPVAPSSSGSTHTSTPLEALGGSSQVHVTTSHEPGGSTPAVTPPQIRTPPAPGSPR